MKHHRHAEKFSVEPSANARRSTFSEQENAFKNLLLRVATASSAFGQLKMYRQTSTT